MVLRVRDRAGWIACSGSAPRRRSTGSGRCRAGRWGDERLGTSASPHLTAKVAITSIAHMEQLETRSDPTGTRASAYWPPPTWRRTLPMSRRGFPRTRPGIPSTRCRRRRLTTGRSSVRRAGGRGPSSPTGHRVRAGPGGVHDRAATRHLRGLARPPVLGDEPAADLHPPPGRSSRPPERRRPPPPAAAPPPCTVRVASAGSDRRLRRLPPPDPSALFRCVRMRFPTRHRRPPVRAPPELPRSQLRTPDISARKQTAIGAADDLRHCRHFGEWRGFYSPGTRLRRRPGHTRFLTDREDNAKLAWRARITLVWRAARRSSCRRPRPGIAR